MGQRKNPLKHWVNRKEMVALLQITGQSFDAWNVQSVGKIGKNKYFTLQDVIENRKALLAKKLEAKFLALVPDEEEALNPIAEKSKLDQAKRIGQEINNKKAVGDVFPIEAGGFVFARIGAEIAAILESLPAKIKRLMPTMTATQLDMVKLEIAKARNSAVSVNERFDEFIEEHYTQPTA